MLIPYAYILPVMTINLQERLFAVCPRINLASWPVTGILCGLNIDFTIFWSNGSKT